MKRTTRSITGYSLVNEHEAAVEAFEAKVADIASRTVTRRGIVRDRLAALEAEHRILDNLDQSIA